MFGALHVCDFARKKPPLCLRFDFDPHSFARVGFVCGSQTIAQCYKLWYVIWWERFLHANRCNAYDRFYSPTHVRSVCVCVHIAIFMLLKHACLSLIIHRVNFHFICFNIHLCVRAVHAQCLSFESTNPSFIHSPTHFYLLHRLLVLCHSMVSHMHNNCFSYICKCLMKKKNWKMHNWMKNRVVCFESKSEFFVGCTK